MTDEPILFRPSFFTIDARVMVVGVVPPRQSQPIAVMIKPGAARENFRRLIKAPHGKVGNQAVSEQMYAPCTHWSSEQNQKVEATAAVRIHQDWIEAMAAAAHWGTIRVKVADLLDNSDPYRLRALPVDNAEFLSERYGLALQTLESII